VFKFVLLVCYALFSVVAIAQSNSIKHPSTLGVHFILNDFTSSGLFKQPASWDKGVSVSYLKGVNNNFDWSIAINGVFSDSASQNVAIKEKSLALSSDYSLRARMFGRKTFFQPFLAAGVGASLYKQHIGAYGLIGPGIELNYRDAYFLFSAQYRPSFTSSLNSHYFYSIGIAGYLGENKKKKSVVKQAPFITAPRPIATDRDKDGILDSLDRCPDVPGILAFHGCPDLDTDGIEDRMDDCPTVYGLKRYKGCPIPDSDKDGINDEEDSCRLAPGILKYHGCPIPDRDGDGVNDEEDKCIDVPGEMQNRGCPVIKQEVKDKIDLAAKNIFFKTGSYELLPKSYASLNDVVKVLKENPELKLSIEGHTDSEGSENDNKLLSENRAKAVLDYLVQKGVSKKRLTALGYGEEKPIADNSTSDGKAKNRRVEMKLST